ncbi:hypothetical protein [Streptomyces sp. NBC_00236]|uniref:hypothetical protein n=1 Tax=Streptomyces sp. NBC_00236 TaxID=2903639 RepID=UPI002E2DF7BC|nr:hypothetical protein [Streptomyces sp. NBC_00236]
MLVHALLAVIAARDDAARRAPAGSFALTCDEVQRLLTSPSPDAGPHPADSGACSGAWSTWHRCRRQ